LAARFSRGSNTVGYIKYRRCAYISIWYNNNLHELQPTTPVTCCSLVEFTYQLAGLRSTYYHTYILFYYVGIYTRAHSAHSRRKIGRRHGGWWGGHRQKWVTVSPAETGSPRVRVAPRNRITGSPGGWGGCLSVRGRFLGWNVRAQSSAAATTIIDPFRCDLVRRQRYTHRTHTYTILRTAAQGFQDGFVEDTARTRQMKISIAIEHLQSFVCTYIISRVNT